MYSVLVVDDEIIAIEGIKSGLDWDKLEISEVFTAYNIRQAKKVFEAHKVDIMLCDIEMPQGNGIELLEWVSQNYPDTISVFLTCHADFSYAKQAIKLGCLDYLLKPIPFDELTNVVSKAIGEIKNRTELMENSRFGMDWIKNKHLVVENFWMDILNENIGSMPELIKEAANNRNVPYDENVKVLPILIVQQQWNIELSPIEKKAAREEFKKFISEMIIKSDGKGELIKLAHRRYLAILYKDVSEPTGVKTVENDCKEFINKSREMLSCDISCYIGDEVYSYELLEIVNRLEIVEENYSVNHNKVYLLSNTEMSLASVKIPDMSIWAVMLSEDKKDKVIEEVRNVLNKLKLETELDKNIMHRFQQDYLQMIYTFLKQKGMQAHQLLNDSVDVELHENANKSINNLLKWIEHVTEKSVKHVKSVDESQSVVDKSIKFIMLNIDKNITRDDVANNVFLNADYLTRIFKRETGLSISEFIAEQRINKAKELLEKTDMPVSSVALTIGYTNFSHFSKMFRKHTGMSPQDYRNKN